MPKKGSRKTTTAAATTTTTTSRKRKASDTSDAAAPVEDVLKRKKWDENQRHEALGDLFKQYQDAEDERIGPNGVEKLCNDLKISTTSLTALVLAGQLGASEMGYFTRDEFVGGMERLKLYDLQGLKSHLTKTEKEVRLSPPLFADLYKFAFGFCCDANNKKSIDTETAAAMVELLLPKGPHTEKFCEFLRQSGKYKVINKDQWSCFLEFTRNVQGDLSNYDTNEAWPLLIDEFVEYIRS